MSSSNKIRSYKAKTLLLTALVGLPLLSAPQPVEARLGGGSSYSSSRSSSRSSSYSSSSSRSSSSSSSRSSGSSYSSGRSYSSGSSYSSGRSSGSYSSGSYSSGSYHSSSSSNDSGSAIVGLMFLIFLMVLFILAVVFIIWIISKAAGAGRNMPSSVVDDRPDPLAEIKANDVNFSEPVFTAFANLTFSRLHEARGAKQPQLVAAFLAPATLREVESDPQLMGIKDVLVGGQSITQGSISRSNNLMTISVRFEACYTEVMLNGPKEIYTEESWVFVKNADVPSKAPEATLAMGCPSCGNTGEMNPDGSCPYCSQVVNKGQFQWVVAERRVTLKQPKPPMEMQPGNMEEGTDWPTVYPADFANQKRAFQGRHPDFNWEEFRKRVENIFMNLQAAWSGKNFDQARPFEMDVLFDTHRFWVERYRSQGLTNHLQDIKITQVVPCLIDRDAFYERITVRIYAQMRDWTTDGTGKLVGGDDKKPRRFSEYWTFLRRIGSDKPTSADLSRCPNCGASLDNVAQNGVCNYCQTQIASGEFDWVLASIDQDEAYRQSAA